MNGPDDQAMLLGALVGLASVSVAVIALVVAWWVQRK